MTALATPWQALARIGSPGRRAVRWAGGVTALLLVVALVAVAGFPTGASTPAGVVPPAARLAARDEVAGVHVMLTIEGGDQLVRVAYDGDKGWLDVALEPVPGATVAAWVSTAGDGPVPSLSAVSGRAPGEAVRIEWADGATERVTTARDGAYVVARRGRVEVERVVVLGAGGEVVLEVTEL